MNGPPVGPSVPGGYRFTILGCGSSPGVPRIGNDWGGCNPDNPKNRRLRSSMLVEKFSEDGTGVTRVLVDTSPDLRQQMLAADVDWVDGVVYTHPHADHIHGIDDLRAFVVNRRRRVDIYADDFTTARLFEAFRYCFETPEGSGYPPILNAHRIAAAEVFVITGEGGDVPVLPIRLIHGGIDSLGFRFGSLVYSPDLSALPDESRSMFAGLDTWIIDALMYNAHPSHLSVSEACELAESVGVRLAVLTHLHTPVDYDELNRRTPDFAIAAYDGMSLIREAGSLAIEVEDESSGDIRRIAG